MPFEPISQSELNSQSKGGFQPIDTKLAQGTPSIQPISKDTIKQRLSGKSAGEVAGKALGNIAGGMFKQAGSKREAAQEALQSFASRPGGGLPTTGAMGVLSSPLRAAGTTVETAMSGVGRIGGGVGQMGVGLYEGATGQFGEGKAGDRMLTGLFGQVVPGAYQTVASPIAGAASVAPSNVQGALRGFGEVLNYIPTEVVKATGIDPESEKGKAMVEAVGLIQDAGIFAAGKGVSALSKTPAAQKGIKAVSEVAEKGRTGIKNTFDYLGQKFGKDVPKNVLNDFKKGVKPHLPGKTTISTSRAYDDNVLKALDAITDNKDMLQLTDADGMLVKYSAPKNLKQLGEALEQTKRSIYSQYDDMARQAGGQGVSIGTDDIARNLDDIINDDALRLSHPEAINYAQQLKDRYGEMGNLDITTAQDVVQNLNKNLESFYRNPDYTNASRAGIDALVANNLRKNLDDVITKATGPGYGDLRGKYGALKAIERDVMKAYLRDARKNVKGLIDYTDIFSGGQAVNAIASMSGAGLAQAGAQKAIASFFKRLNDPNKAIQKAFKTLEKAKGKGVSNVLKKTHKGIANIVTSPKTTYDVMSQASTAVPVPDVTLPGAISAGQGIRQIGNALQSQQQ